MHITVTHAKTIKDKGIGLIGKKSIEPLYFETRWGIHTFGVRFPIDVVILKEDQTVVAIKKNLKPNRTFLWNPKYKKVLELPEGTVEKEHIKLGEKIGLKLA